MGELVEGWTRDSSLPSLSPMMDLTSDDLEVGVRSRLHEEEEREVMERRPLNGLCPFSKLSNLMY